MLIERGAGCITKKDAIIHVPVRFAEVGLAELSGRTYVFGLIPIIDAASGEYGVLNACTMVELSPSKVLKTVVKDEEYYELHFYAGGVVITDMNCVKKDTLPYSIIDEVIFKGKVPWYVDYVDLGKIYDTARIYANSNVGESSETVEFIASLMYRSEANRTVYAREIMKGYDEHDKMAYIPLKSVIYAANNTLNKLTGSYFKDGVNSAIVNPTKKVEAIESILRA
jgi:hypothetical protein